LIVEKYIDIKFDNKSTSGYDKRKKEYANKCPECGEVGKTEFQGLHEFWYCENPECRVNVHFYGGYYVSVESDKKPVRLLTANNPDDVQVLGFERNKKRSVNKNVGVSGK
jgi:hypothetical protein